MRLLFLVAGVVSTSLLVASCSDECSKYSAFSCKQIRDADYNVYFYFPSEVEEYLGQATGLVQCGSIARSFASEKKVGDKNWSYICCMIAKGSSCYEKHR
jgi:hypothetical protein